VTVVLLPELHGPFRGARFLLAALMLPYILLRYRIGTVHINGHWESALLLPCRLLGRRAISTRHQTWDIKLKHWWHAPKRSAAALIYNVNARFAHMVICVSQAVADEVRHHIRSEKAVVIPNWIRAQPPFAERRAERGTLRVLFIGRMVHFKGLHLLIDAVRDLPEVTVTAVGEGAMLEELRSKALGLQVHFAGFHPDVTPFYREADVFVMPSIGLEGLPLVSIEAMGHGLPCLFSDLPVHREITGDGSAALLFQTGNAEDLRRKLLTLVHDPDMRNRLARAGYANVKAQYTAEVARRSYIEAFELERTSGCITAGVHG
jgi:glycosyltransferase involved in cell wall biosynthesis